MLMRHFLPAPSAVRVLSRGVIATPFSTLLIPSRRLLHRAPARLHGATR
jgi:hypothetical protein